MTRHLSILILVLLITLSLEAQKIPASKLYDGKGRLIADTTLIISHKQLKKWMLIEDTLTRSILKCINYPQPEFENGMSGKVIISFTLDANGNFNDFRLEKYQSKWSQDSIKSDITDFKKETFRVTRLFSGALAKKGFKTKENKIYKFYLPFEFIAGDRWNNHLVINDWLTLEKKYPPLMREIQK